MSERKQSLDPIDRRFRFIGAGKVVRAVAHAF